MIGDKGATAQSTVVTKNVFVPVLVLCSPRIIRFARRGMCAAMSGNVVKRLANPDRVNLLFDVISQPDT